MPQSTWPKKRTFAIWLAARHLNSIRTKKTNASLGQVADSLLLKPYASYAAITDLEKICLNRYIRLKRDLHVLLDLGLDCRQFSH